MKRQNAGVFVASKQQKEEEENARLAAEAAAEAAEAAEADMELLVARELAPETIANYARPVYNPRGDTEKHSLDKYVGFPITNEDKNILKAIIEDKIEEHENECYISKNIDCMLVRIIFKSPPNSKFVYAHTYTRYRPYMCTIPVTCSDMDQLRMEVKDQAFMLRTECTLKQDKIADVTTEKHRTQTRSGMEILTLHVSKWQWQEIQTRKRKTSTLSCYVGWSHERQS